VCGKAHLSSNLTTESPGSLLQLFQKTIQSGHIYNAASKIFLIVKKTDMFSAECRWLSLKKTVSGFYRKNTDLK